MNEYTEKSNNNECVRVIVRCRPISEQETCNGFKTIVHILPDGKSIGVYDPKNKNKFTMFTFDAVYDCMCTQQELFDISVCPLVDSVLNGFSATVFAYGQTGTGKTYTMEGSDDAKGMIPRTFQHIFDHISESHDNTEYLIRASYLEVYNEEIRDLSNVDTKQKCELRETGDAGIYVKNLQSFACKNVEQILNIMETGRKNRTVGLTNMNERSSRSHAIFMVTIEMSDINENPSMNKVKVGTINLVDLAGSECLSKTEATGDKLKEGCKINLSLSALSKVINTLVTNRDQYIPYRDSKLTRLLQNSLGGNSRTLMIANVGPACYNYSETLTTLRYANRAKNIKNTPRINEDPKDALIREYQKEIERLKSLLAVKKNKNQKNLNLKSSSFSSLKVLVEKPADMITSDCFHGDDTVQIIDDENKYAEELRIKIESMENSLLRGTSNVLQSEVVQKILDSRSLVIKEKENNEKILQQIINFKEEITEEIKDNYCTLQQEVEMKRFRLKKLYEELLNLQKQTADANEDFNSKRRDLEDLKNDLYKQSKWKTLVINNFIPQEVVDRSLLKLVYEEEEEHIWEVNEKINNITKMMKSPIAYRDANSKFTYLGLFATSNPRFRKENIIDLSLDKFSDYQKPRKQQCRARLLLQKILRPEANIAFDAASPKFQKISNLYTANNKYRKSVSSLKEPSSLPTKSKDPVNYPKPRGLVKK